MYDTESFPCARNTSSQVESKTESEHRLGTGGPDLIRAPV